MRSANRIGVASVLALSVVARLAGAGPAEGADLGVENAAPATTGADEDVAFTMTITNNGPDSADTTDLSTNLPDGASFVSMTQSAGPTFVCSTPAIGSDQGQAVDCNIASLDSGQSASFVLTVHVASGVPLGTYVTDIATASSDTFDPNDENQSATASTQAGTPPAADMRVAVTVAPGSNPGQTIRSFVEIANGGPEAATNVVVTIQQDAELVHTDRTQTPVPLLTCTTPSPGVTQCTAASLAAGASVTLTTVETVPGSAGDGTTYQSFVHVASDFDENSENDDGTGVTCIQGNSCAAGACNQNHAVVCGAAAQCRALSTCDTVTGLCPEAGPGPDGVTCDDGNLCSQTDTCQGGTCVGGNPVVCATATSCQVQSTCNPATGTCPATRNRPDGTFCDDGDLCTQFDACRAGSCIGDLPVECRVATACQTQGVCDPQSGFCAPNRPLTDGTTCDDENGCTTGDTCQAGACVGTAFCPLAGPCEIQGSCDESTHQCGANTPAPDGTECEDGDGCTTGDTCAAGACVPGAPRVCPAPGPCRMAATCDQTSGDCPVGAPLPGGSECDDGNACTTGETCQEGGLCGGATAVDCDDHDDCTTDTCDRADGCRHVDHCADGGVVVTFDAPPRPDARPARDAGVGPDARPVGADARFITNDAGMLVATDDGGCRVAGGRSRPSLSWLLVVAALIFRRYRSTSTTTQSLWRRAYQRPSSR